MVLRDRSEASLAEAVVLSSTTKEFNMDKSVDNSMNNSLETTSMDKSLDVTSTADAQSGKVSDIKTVGNSDMFQLLCKASSRQQGWMKSCKAMQVPGGCLVQVTTQQGDNVAEALAFVPGVAIVDDINGGRRLAPLFPPHVDQGFWKFQTAGYVEDSPQ